MQKPIDAAIHEARKRVLEELEGKQCQDKLRDKFVRLFGEITDKASRCNNVSAWQIESEADVKRYVAELEKKLISSLEDNTIINVEF